MSEYKVDAELDVKGFKCPMPMLRTKKALQKMEGGQVLKVMATDPHAKKDLEQFSAQTGNKLLNTEESDGVYTFYIQRKQFP
ncbi:MAG: sulfurtransferase TusA family protein [Burkholderiales bacterium]|nr:sulfurtransferase TusA family protein [Burkholderiales bacterium]